MEAGMNFVGLQMQLQITSNQYGKGLSKYVGRF